MNRRHTSAVSLVALSFCAATLVTADDARSQPGPQGGKFAGQQPLPQPPQPTLAACTQFLQTAANVVPIDGAATATSPTSVTLSFSAPPGEYDVSSTGGFAAKVTIVGMAQALSKAAIDAAPRANKYDVNKATLEKSGAIRVLPGAAAPPPPAAPPAVAAPPNARLTPVNPTGPLAGRTNATPVPAPVPAPAPTPASAPSNLGSATLANAPVAANFKHTYTIKTTLPDGRKGCLSVSATTPPVPAPQPKPQPPPVAKAPLDGWADLHTHPESHLAFGGHLFWGAPDEQSFMTINSQCQVNTSSTNILSAMGPENSCNNLLRKGVTFLAQQLAAGGVGGDYSYGAPYFSQWPAARDGLHQKMWWEWVDRARRYGKLRVMVGLTHNHELLAGAMQGFGPQKDKESSDLQLMEMKAFVARHPTVMEVAYNAADVYRIASSDRVAVVLGVELDRLGNMDWNKPGKTREQAVADEVQRLYDQGVRYVLPIHLQDNDFGGTALYSMIFTIANVLNVGTGFSMDCAPCSDEIGYRTGAVPRCDQACRFPVGHRNQRGLQPLGAFAIKEMMKRGMIVDIDHMSELTANAALALAEQQPGGYPIMSGHGGLRAGDQPHRNAESMRTRAQMERILRLGGMVGLGTDDAESWNWGKQYLEITGIMNRPGSVAIGTDVNSIVKMPKATGRVQTYTPDPPPGPLPAVQPPNEFPQSVATRTPIAGIAPKRYTLAGDGVAHYGMMADFLKDVESATPQRGAGFQGSTVITPLMKSADYFWHMWERCEAAKANVK